MSRPIAFALILVVLATVAVGLWMALGPTPSEAPAPVAKRPEASAEAPPRLVGTAGAASERKATEEVPGKPEPPRRPWETRAGFDLGKDGEVRATGRVVFENGSPAADATVWKAYVYRPFFRAQAESGLHDFFVASTKSDAEGRYRFNAQQLRSKLTGAALLVRHGDLAALLLGPDDDGKHAEIPDLVLGPGVKTRIDVVTVHGDPIPGALGRLEVRLGSKGGADMLLGDVSDADGRLTFLSLPDQTDLGLEVEVEHRQFPDTKQELDVDALRRGEVLRVEMPTGRIVRGRILDTKGERPERVFLRVAGYDAEWKRQQLVAGIQVKPDENGNFELRGVPAVESRLLVFLAPEAMSAFLRVRDLRAHIFDLAAGRHGDVLDLGDVYLEVPGTIRGSVWGPEGEPIVDARVDANVPINGARIGGSATTDATGSFAIENLPAGAYRLRTAHTFPGFGSREVRMESVRPGAAPVELRLQGGSTLVVRFHPEGEPDRKLRVQNYQYSVLSDTDKDGLIMLGGGAGGGRFGSRRGGSFGRPLLRLKMEPGSRSIEFKANGYEPVTIGPVEIFEDSDTAVDVELIPLAE